VGHFTEEGHALNAHELAQALLKLSK